MSCSSSCGREAAVDVTVMEAVMVALHWGKSKLATGLIECGELATTGFRAEDTGIVERLRRLRMIPINAACCCCCCNTCHSASYFLLVFEVVPRLFAVFFSLMVLLLLVPLLLTDFCLP